ncbi:MAG TPA: UDP-N-acetylmuramate dehydrogenase [Acidimicrobiia bacterium]|nr:UDP-N-acetylmuramate dehydrogenase [Acidimicrobiia bacterium]
MARTDHDFAAELAARLAGRVELDASLGGLTTYRVGGRVSALVRAGTVGDLRVVGEVLRGRGVAVLVVGRGSNLLVADEGFVGVAVTLEGEFETIQIHDDTVTAGGGVALGVLARRSAAAGRGGLEFLVGVPGSVGGAVRMNAGGHGREIRDVLVRAETLDLSTGDEVVARTASSLELAYRHSAIARDEVVVRAELAASREPVDRCEARIAEIVRWRREHQPGGANAGSVFTNPPGDSAGRLIDAAGLTGLRVGGAVVSDKHANFIQAEPGALAADVRALIEEVQRRVEAGAGVRLRPELTMIGFAETAGW